MSDRLAPAERATASSPFARSGSVSRTTMRSLGFVDLTAVLIERHACRGRDVQAVRQSVERDLDDFVDEREQGFI